MTFFRQNIAPLIIVLVFVFALVAASARIFLPSDMSAPAPLSGTLSLAEPVRMTIDLHSMSALSDN